VENGALDGEGCREIRLPPRERELPCIICLLQKTVQKEMKRTLWLLTLVLVSGGCICDSTATALKKDRTRHSVTKALTTYGCPQLITTFRAKATPRGCERLSKFECDD
jgi:hypothetical protein